MQRCQGAVSEMGHTHQGAAQTPTEKRLSNIDVNARAQPEDQVTPWITLALTYRYLLTVMD